MLNPTQSLRSLAGLRPAEAQVMEWIQMPSVSLKHHHLCLLNWNIAKQNHQSHWQQEFDRIFERYTPDLLFFQEARLSWPVADTEVLLNSHPHFSEQFSWYFTPNLIHHRDSYASGVLTASMSQSLSNFALHSHHCEPLLKTPKVALVAEYPIADQSQTLLTINVHGINFVRSHKFQAQLHQIEDAIAHHTGPLLLVGDFNTWRSKRMQMLHQSIDRLQLQPVHFGPDCQNQLKRFLLSDPLDHVFYRGLELLPQHTKVLGDLQSSDHKPMIVTFQIPATESTAP